VTKRDEAGQPISSSSQPAIMAIMLDQLDLAPGLRVLEIGAGTGYNAALLCSVVGASRVTTIDVDDELVTLATQRLRRLGHRPTAVAGDGALGYRANSPFDRILATCSTWPISTEWIEQLAVGGMVLCNVLNSLDGGLVRIRKTGEGCATGRFLPCPAYFISMRGSRAEQPPVSEFVQAVTQPVGDVRDTMVPPDIGDDSFRLFSSLYLQDVVWFGSPGEASVEEAPSLVGLSDGSWARIDLANGRARVTQYGERRLWDTFERTYHRWTDLVARGGIATESASRRISSGCGWTIPLADTSGRYSCVTNVNVNDWKL
jgi:protein-L-isoaspartate O-methyltransferase